MMWNWRRWPWSEDEGRVSTGVHKRAEKQVKDKDEDIAKLTAHVGRLIRKNEELVDKIKIRDNLIADLRMCERVLLSRVESYTALFERKRLDHMAGIPETEE